MTDKSYLILISIVFIILLVIPNAYADIKIKGQVSVRTAQSILDMNSSDISINQLKVQGSGITIKTTSSDLSREFNFSSALTSPSSFHVQMNSINHYKGNFTVLTNGLTDVVGTVSSLKLANLYLNNIASSFSWNGVINSFSIGSNKSISEVFYNTFFILKAFLADGITTFGGNVYQSNLTSANNIFPINSGQANIPGMIGIQNFTIKDSSTLFVTNKTYNYNTIINKSLNTTTFSYYVDCASTGTGTDFQWFTNGTTNHRITSFAPPICYTNNTVKWHVYWKANGQTNQNDTTQVRVQVLNNTFSINPTSLTANGTIISTSFANPWIVSNSIFVGSGLNDVGIYFVAKMAYNPNYIPINYTAGNLSVNGSNHQIQPIQITSSPSGSNTVVTFTYPTTYTLGVTARFQMENKSQSFSGLSRSFVDAAHVSSSITFKNATNDIITMTARDTGGSGVNANYSLAQSSSSIPLIQQIQNFRNGYYGTHGQFGVIDLVTLIVLIFSMVGMNRVNETLGLVFNLIVVGGLAYFGILSWPTIMVPAIAMMALVIVGSTKKLPWS